MFVNDKIKKNLKNLLILTIFIFSIITLKNEVGHIQRSDIKNIIDNIGVDNLVIMILLGVFLFSFSIGYDIFMARKLDMKLSLKNIINIGWICQSFNYTVGMAGIAGFSIRKSLYAQEGQDSKKADKVSIAVIIYSASGLFVLSLLSIINFKEIGTNYKALFILVDILFLMVYLFIDKLQRFFKRELVSFEFLDFKTKLPLILISAVEWIFASLYFSILFKLLGRDLSIVDLALIYSVSTMAGIISMIPGGFGSFEGTVLMLGRLYGVSTDVFFPVLIIFRLGYYIVPWLIGIVLFGLTEYKFKTENKNYALYLKMTRNLLGTLTLISGIMMMLSAHLPVWLEFLRYSFAGVLIERNVPIISLYIGLVLAVISKTIFTGIKKGYYIVIIIMAATSIYYFIEGYSILMSTLLLLIAMSLVLNKKAFENKFIKFKVENLKNALFITVFGMVVYGVIYNIFHKINFFTSKGKYSLSFIMENWYWILCFLFITTISSLIVIYISRDNSNMFELTEEQMELYEDLKKEYPNTMYSQIFYSGDKYLFFNQEKNVAIIYTPYGNNLFALGDPIGDSEYFVHAIDEFVAWGTSIDMLVSFYEVSNKYLDSYIANGFRLLKLGEEAKVDLSELTTEGKKGRNNRSTLNKMATEQCTFEVLEPPLSNETFQRLKQVSDEWLNGRKEMGFSIGVFDEEYLNRNKVFVIRDKNGDIVAFSNLIEVLNTSGIAIDLMRHKRDSINGIMDILFVSIMIWAKQEGYEYFNIGISPLSNLGEKPYSDGYEKLLNLAYKFGNKIYSFKGLRSYKEKFRPNWSNVYLAYKDNKVITKVLIDLFKLCHVPRD